MLDTAAIIISQGKKIAYAYAEGVNDNMTQSHFHDFFELYYLLEGERMHMIEGEIYHLTANDFVLFPPHIMHHSYGEKDMPFKRIVLYFSPDLIANDTICQLLSEKELLFVNEGYIPNQILSLLLSLTHEIDVPGKYHDAYICNQLAEILYVSPYHLCHEFKNATGKTIIQYLNTTRILHAQRLMLETDYNITQISREVGFSNLTHFNRTFKKITGVAPREKKKLYQK